MGQNLILNMNDHGFTVVAYNRTTDKVDAFLANEAKGTKVLGAHSIEENGSRGAGSDRAVRRSLACQALGRRRPVRVVDCGDD